MSRSQGARMKRFLRNTTTGIWSKPGAEVKGMAFTASRTSVNDTSTKSRSPGGRCVPHAKSIAAWRLSLEGGRDGKKTGANAAALPSSVETTSPAIDKESTSPWARGWDSRRYKDQRSAIYIYMSGKSPGKISRQTNRSVQTHYFKFKHQINHL